MQAKPSALLFVVGTLLLVACDDRGNEDTRRSPASSPVSASQPPPTAEGDLTEEMALAKLRDHFAGHSVMCAYDTTFPARVEKRALRYRPGLQQLVDAGVVEVAAQGEAIILTPKPPYFDQARGLMCAGTTEPISVTLKPLDENRITAEFTLNIRDVPSWAASPETTANANPGFLAPASYNGKTLTNDALFERTSDGWRLVPGRVGKPK